MHGRTLFHRVLHPNAALLHLVYVPHTGGRNTRETGLEKKKEQKRDKG